MDTFVFHNHGRWVVRCPLMDPKVGGPCGGARQVQPGDQAFFCPSCENKQANGKPVRTVWPPEELRQGVERALSLRPLEENRNWVPGESVDDLARENRMHGVG